MSKNDPHILGKESIGKLLLQSIITPSKSNNTAIIFVVSIAKLSFYLKR